MSGKNLLHNSVQKADVKSIRLLLDLEAYPTTMDQGIEVIEIREDDPVRMLLDYGFDINQRDWNGSTLLHLAAESNWLNSHLEVIQVLLKCGADVHARDKFGSTPLHLLVCTADTEVVRLFLKFGADVDVENLEGKTPLFEAVRFRNIKVAKLLVDNGADVNVVSYSGATPLEAACNLMSQHPDMFKLLVRSGASIEAVGRELFHNSKASLEVLLKYSDVNRVDENGKNILSIHPQSKNWKTALEHLAKMQALDLDVNTSLLDTISSRDDYSFYFVQCEEELLTAKRIKLRDCWVTFFNLLTDCKRKLKNYAGNKGLVEEFEKSDCLKNYLIYGAEMQKKVESGLKRRKLFDESTFTLSDCLPIFNPNHLIIRGILDCLTSETTLKFLNVDGK